MGLVHKAQALVDLRTPAGQAGDQGWRTLLARAGSEADTSDRFAPYAAVTEYNNRQLREEILPLYAEMIALFTREYRLAEESTRRHLGTVIKFHEMWCRQLSEAPLPLDALRAMPQLDGREHPDLMLPQRLRPLHTTPPLAPPRLNCSPQHNSRRNIGPPSCGPRSREPVIDSSAKSPRRSQGRQDTMSYS
jgi:hypothetical protein